MNHYVKPVLTVGPKILGSYFAWMRKFAKNPKKYPFDYRYQKIKKLLIALTKSFNIEYHVDGLENFPKGKCAIFSNHYSAYDPVVLMCVTDTPATFVAKKELEKVPFAGKVITGIDGLFLDRNDLKQSLKVMMKVEASLKDEELKNWIIYPEGTRNKDSMKNVQEFHHGTFRPAVKARVPIVPVAIYGTSRALKQQPDFKRYPIFVKILKPIYPEEYESLTTNQIAAMVQEQIDTAVNYDLRLKDHAEMVKIGNKNYKFNKVL